ncbi:MAG TPA: ATP-binding protein, partial [Aggregatilineales bacterium]|nr:ATP-binding protein [Aggregatilineales bacterium]
LLDTARFDSGIVSLKLGDICLQDLVRDVVAVQQPEAAAKNISLTMVLTPTPLHVQADESRMRQVITNLIVNAIHYTPAGGRVTLSLELEEAAHQFAHLHVTDTGVGIRPEDISRIFEPFFRADQDSGVWQGTGLGLPISREIVELHGGSLTAESEVGVGSTFCVRLLLSSTNGESGDAGRVQP